MPLRLFKNHFPIFLAAGIVAGLISSPWLVSLHALVDYCVAAIIFVGFFSRPQSVEAPWPPWSFIATFALQKIFLPLVLFYTAREFAPQIALGLALIAALPAAAISPAIARLTGGDVNFSLKLLTYESLLTCLSIPVVFAIATSGSSVVNPLEIAQYVLTVLFLPMLLAEGARHVWTPVLALKTKDWAEGVSIGLIIMLVTLIAAKVQPTLVQDPSYSLGLVGLGLLLAPFFALVGVLTGRPDEQAKAISMAVKTMYVNIGLGMGLASSQLDEHGSLLVLAYMIPINIMPRLASHLARRVYPFLSKSRGID